MNGQLLQAIADLQEKEVVPMVNQRLQAGEAPLALLGECQEGMKLVGQRYEAGDYFLSELIYASEIFRKAAAVIETKMEAPGPAEPLGTVVIGTAQGDIHDLGKDIVVNLLKGAGFEVHDLGVDVPPERFLEKVKETRASIVGISGLITPCFAGMRETIELLQEAGLRDQVKVLIGGGVTTDQVREYVGADAQTTDAQAGVAICRRWATEGE